MSNCSVFDCNEKTVKGEITSCAGEGYCHLFKNQFCEKHTKNPSSITKLKRMFATLHKAVKVEA